VAESSVHIENGWALYAHPLFVRRLDEITSEIERAAAANPEGFHRHPSYKLFDAVTTNILYSVPANPAHPNYRQGRTLGKDYLHWFRVKKQGMLPRYRLFFQFRSEAPKTIIYAWLNNERTIRKIGDKNDVYAVFAAMLKNAKMPNAFDDLMAACDGFDLMDEPTATEEE
jgi:toxin YhaV